jgi:ABC-type uncharacterized transport system auxiliary subunit
MQQSLPSAKTGVRILQGCFFLLFFLIGCIGPAKPQIQIDQYLINYPAPVFEKQAPVDSALKVERFSIAGAYNNRNMIFRRNNCSVDSFNYNRWVVNPADMITDYFLRDLQQSGFFRAVFSRYAPDEGRFVLQGGVEEFFLSMDNTPRAVLSLEVTLKDIKQREAPRRFLFQRRYREEESLKIQSPEGFCSAMSIAMERLSRRITNDIYQAVK